MGFAIRNTNPFAHGLQNALDFNIHADPF